MHQKIKKVLSVRKGGYLVSTRQVFCVILSLSVVLSLCHVAMAKSVSTDAEMPSQQALEKDELKEWNNQIRRDKFDLVLPQVMKKNNIDMWIHVMREQIPDRFGAGELGSTSGVFVFTDRGGDRIERAVLGRRWGATQREVGEVEIKGLQPSSLVEESGAYDIIFDPVFVAEPVGSPMTEYDYRFTGLR